MDSMFEHIEKTADLRQQLMFLAQGAAVKRYHTTLTLQQQTVGQHSHGVMILCWLLTAGQCSAALLMAAATHDMAEQVTGDIPSPTKWALGVNDLFTAHEEKFLRNNGAYFALTEAELKTLTLADRLEGMLFCVTERQLGNAFVTQIYQRFRTAALPSITGPLQMQIFSAITVLWTEVNR